MAKTAYVLSKRIARGGMAEIFLGKAVGEDEFQRIVAIKRILPHYAQDKEFVEMFRDEAHICKRLQHANIVQVYDFTEVEGSFALIMEHVDGADLRTLLSACENARVRLSVPQALYITACTARGLHYAHTKSDEITGKPLGIIHRDVSPQNILISYEGEVKITDFGIASAESKITETRPGVVKGKYSYMSPEQVAAKNLDARSDVFSLAIVLWEGLAMKRLFSGTTEVETIRKVQACEIPLKLTDLNPDVDADLMNIVHRGLAKDPKKRFPTAATFEKTLLKYLHSKYPDFVASELGDFLKEILASRREKNQDDIKHTLTTGETPRSPVKDSTKELIRGVADKVEQPEAKPEEASGLKGIQLQLEDTPSREISVSYKSKPFALALDVNAPTTNTHAQPSPATNPNTGLNNPAARQQTGIGRVGTVARGPREDLLLQPRGVKQRKPSLALPFFAVVFFGLFIFFFFFDRQSKSQGNVHFELKTVPQIVQVTLNGKRLKGGAFVRTPLSLELTPGKYQLQIERPGYDKEVLRFSGVAGDVVKPLPAILKRDPSVPMMNVRITSSPYQVVADFDNGLGKGQTPMLVRDVRADSPHVINFTTMMEGDQRRMMRCTIRAPGTDADFFIDIQISRDGKSRCIGRVGSGFSPPSGMGK